MKRAGRRSLISGIMALSLVLAGTGYAYWTDTLQVTTKATTGNFGVTFVDLGLYAQYGNEIEQNGWSIVDGIERDGFNPIFVDDEFFMRGSSDYNAIAKPGTIEKYKERQAGYNNIEFDARLVDPQALPKNVGPYTNVNTKGSDKIEVEINKMYPGYAQAFRADILNVGDIAAKLSEIRFSVDAQNQGNVKDMLGIALLVNREQYKPSHHEEDVFKLAKHFGEDAVFQVGKVDFVRLSALENADADKLNEFLKNNEVLCAPATDQRMDLFLGVAMDPDAEGKYTTGSVADFDVYPPGKDEANQNKEAKVYIDLGWDQFNVGKDAPNPNILVKQNR